MTPPLVSLGDPSRVAFRLLVTPLLAALRAEARVEQTGKPAMVTPYANRLYDLLMAQGMAARSGETAQQAQPEGQQPGPQDAPNG